MHLRSKWITCLWEDFYASHGCHAYAGEHVVGFVMFYMVLQPRRFGYRLVLLLYVRSRQVVAAVLSPRSVLCDVCTRPRIYSLS